MALSNIFSVCLSRFPRGFLLFFKNILVDIYIYIGLYCSFTVRWRMMTSEVEEKKKRNKRKNERLAAIDLWLIARGGTRERHSRETWQRCNVVSLLTLLLNWPIPLASYADDAAGLWLSMSSSPRRILCPLQCTVYSNWWFPISRYRNVLLSFDWFICWCCTVYS